MSVNIKPLVKIGDKVNIKKGMVVQTSFGFNIVHLYHQQKGLYEVFDIEVITSLRTGEIKYKYLIGSGKNPFDTKGEERKWIHCGWVDGDYLDIVEQKEVLAV